MDNIKDRLRKIKALADRGVAGEARAAQLQLEKLLAKHDLTIHDLFNEERRKRMFKVKAAEGALFINILASIIGNRAHETTYYVGKKTEQYTEITDVEWIDVSQQFDFHKKQLAKERKKALKTLVVAYIHKHHLFNCEESESKPSKPMTMEEYLEIMAMKNRLEDVTFRKQLNQ